MKKIFKKQNGITLIALIITIIVLLILAGVSIGMLTGKNGIMNNAKEAKTETEYKSAEEKVNLAIIKTMADDGQMTVEELRREIERQGGSVTGTAFPVQVQMDGYTFTVDAEGNINNNGSGGENKPPVSQGGDEENKPPVNQGTLGTVTGQETTNTTLQDKLGNKVVVPAGFKVQNPDKTVPDGIVIEDVSHGATKGSEFVWIPVGTVKKADGSTTTIKLSRYTFDVNGKETDKGEENADDYYYESQEPDQMTGDLEYSNVSAKDIGAFKTSVGKNNGYYIGRYEARNATKRTDRNVALAQLTTKPKEFVYNWVKQLDAARLSRTMYDDNNFTSDLVNSYAWDTAIIFLQAFDNRENKTTPYSRQISLNTSLAEKGTNNLGTKDVICNVYDMASNTHEFTTETGCYPYPDCTYRGGKYGDDYATTSYRNAVESAYHPDLSNFEYVSFRPILYL